MKVSRCKNSWKLERAIYRFKNREKFANEIKDFMENFIDVLSEYATKGILL